jgi:predicted aldo/keto reductase-like oxidoreductase
MVLSGMSSIAQIKDNISYMKDFKSFDGEEQKIIEKIRVCFVAINRIIKNFL